MKAQKPLKISEKCNDQTPNHAHLKKKNLVYFTFFWSIPQTVV